jgi:hypothetical protein
MLREIERIYAALSKPLRIRDERSTGPSNGGRTAINTLQAGVKHDHRQETHNSI